MIKYWNSVLFSHNFNKIAFIFDYNYNNYIRIHETGKNGEWVGFNENLKGEWVDQGFFGSKFSKICNFFSKLTNHFANKIVYLKG